MFASLSDICKRMKIEGFDYCSHVDPHAMQKMTATPDDIGRDYNGKPTQCAWFSLVKRTCTGDGTGYLSDVWGTEWFQFLTEQEFEGDYPLKDLLFTKFDCPRLTNDADPRFEKAGEFRDDRGYANSVHWRKVASQYAGIHVDRNTLNPVFRGWDVDTVCVWDPTVFTEIQWFPNSGKPWEYEVLF